MRQWNDFEASWLEALNSRSYRPPAQDVGLAGRGLSGGPKRRLQRAVERCSRSERSALMKIQTPGLGSRLELWGGVECSVVRLGEAFRDQIAETGHRDRFDDLQAIAALGIRTLRYPVVWETIAPDHPDACDWGWQDRQMSHLRRLGIRPI